MLLDTPFPEYEKLQAILEKSIAKGQFAHRGITQAPFQLPTGSSGGDEEDGILSHIDLFSLPLLEPFPQPLTHHTLTSSSHPPTSAPSTKKSYRSQSSGKCNQVPSDDGSSDKALLKLSLKP